ncbi:MAG: hypothetical protein ACU0CA_04690 [Paracoccaceae bacterium]
MPDTPNRYRLALKFAAAGFIGGAIWLIIAKVTGSGPEMSPLVTLGSTTVGGFAGGLIRQKRGRDK